MTTNPKPTPSTFFRANAEPTEEIRKPVDPVIPSASPSSLGFDAMLPPTDGLIYSSSLRPWEQVLAGWRAQIAAEQIIDVETRFYRTATKAAPLGLSLRATDGALMRRENGEPLAFTPHAWGQLISILIQEIPNKPTSGAAKAYAFLDPATRSVVFDSLKARSRRKEGAGNELLLRTFIEQRSGARALRAVVTGRHSGVHFDDLALSRALESLLPASAQAFVYRDVNSTRGHAVLEASRYFAGGEKLEEQLRYESEARASISWSNSETGTSSLGFAGGCYITALDTLVRGASEEKVEVELDVTIARTSDRTRRAHTLPCKDRSENERAQIAQTRMASDIATATDRAREMVEAWKRALVTFAPNFRATSEDRLTDSEVALDLIEENTRGFKDEDRAALRTIFTENVRLRALPFASAAYIAGAWALLAREAKTFAEADRLQAEAARWIMAPPFSK